MSHSAHAMPACKPVANIVAALMLLVVLVTPLCWQWPRVHQITVSPLVHMDLAGVSAGLNLDCWAGMSMMRSLSPLYQRLDHLPWVKHWQVFRQWPQGLRIEIIERQPLAQLNDGRLLAQDGSLFKPDPATVPSGLVSISVSSSTSDEAVLAAYRYWKALEPWIKTYHHGIRRVDIDAHGLITFHAIDSEIIMLGRTFTQERVQRLKKAFEFLAAKHIPYHTIDMRYPHGFTVQ